MGSQRSDAVEAVCRRRLQAVVSHGHWVQAAETNRIWDLVGLSANANKVQVAFLSSLERTAVFRLADIGAGAPRHAEEHGAGAPVDHKRPFGLHVP